VISSEVQRTLVKSPPELWAEISDPESLARHLGEFGEIRITHVKPEQRVEWEADDASGTVVIKPSGWGTKVKLTVTRELVAPPAPATTDTAQPDGEPDDEQPSAPAPEQAVEQPAHELERGAADTEAVEREPHDATEPDDQPESDADDATIADSSLELESPSAPDSGAEAQEEIESHEEAETHAAAEPAAQPEPEPRRGFFARLFGRRRARTEEPSPVALAEPEPEPEPEPIASEPIETDAQPLAELAANGATQADEQAIDAPEIATDQPQEQVAPAEASTQTNLAEELAAEEVTAVLTGVLDRLGAAHHRPFSRA
jgi:hypothetical protein